MRIYTKTGDTGQTGLVGGTRVSKADPRMHAIGSIDELNACLGLCLTQDPIESIEEPLQWVQNWLFDLGAEIATPEGTRFDNTFIDQRNIGYLEESIDLMTEELPPLSQFILPGGTVLAAQLHLARTICRRAERHLIELSEEVALRPEVLAFVNRLSDWLFVAARTANAASHVEDIAWSKSDWSEE
ncbi:MAG TPA: cob(I)yrinic acid a,c-diamide adenosyltransferase [Fimbriimonadaceae bacterium]|nr:cob(I)yrinic acid a,c-diamide adenosyltransferase [Fimbriimonadaceae bacterium]